MRPWRGCSRSRARARCRTRCAPYDDAINELTFATVQSSVLYGVGATSALRDKAQALTQTANAALTALSLNQPVYRALAALPAPGDAATRHYLEHTLLEYRLAGVDKDDATRARIKALQDRITELGLKFERAVHDDVRTVVVDKEQLDGLPPDYLAAHPPDAQGHVKITTDPPDAWPARRFADNGELRHKLFLARNRSPTRPTPRRCAGCCRRARIWRSCSATPPGRTSPWPTR